MQPITIQFAVGVGLYLYLIFYHRRVDIIDQVQVQLWTPGYTFTPFVRYFTLEQLIIAHCKNGPTAFSVSSETHWQSGVKEIAKVSKWPQWDSNPLPHACQSRALTAKPPRISRENI